MGHVVQRALHKAVGQHALVLLLELLREVVGAAVVPPVMAVRPAAERELVPSLDSSELLLGDAG